MFQALRRYMCVVFSAPFYSYFSFNRAAKLTGCWTNYWAPGAGIPCSACQGLVLSVRDVLLRLGVPDDHEKNIHWMKNVEKSSAISEHVRATSIQSIWPTLSTLSRQAPSGAYTSWPVRSRWCGPGWPSFPIQLENYPAWCPCGWSSWRACTQPWTGRMQKIHTLQWVKIHQEDALHVRRPFQKYQKDKLSRKE